MIKSIHLIIILILLLIFCHEDAVFSQNISRIDSLKKVIAASKNDSVKIKTADELIWEYMYVDPDTAQQITKNYLELFRHSGYIKGISLLNRNIGVSFVLTGEYDSATNRYNHALHQSQTINDIEGIASSYNGLGIIYSRMGNYPKSIDSYIKALRNYEAMNDKSGMANAFNNIGLLYEKKSEYEKSKEYYIKCLKIKEELKSKEGVARSLLNIGNSYYKTKQHKEAFWYYQKSLKAELELNDLIAVGAIYNNMGVIYEDQNEVDSAHKYYELSYKIRTKISDKLGISESLYNLAHSCVQKNDPQQGLKFALLSLKLGEELGALDRIEEANKTLSTIYKLLGNPDKALKHYEAHIAARDSIFNRDNVEKIVQSELQYQFEKEQEKTKLEQEKKDIKAMEDLKRQKIIRNAFIAGFLMILFLVFAIFRNLKQKQKAHQIISQKNKIVEEKNKKILDSIRYARHIQNAILPPDSQIKTFLPESFVFYKPKDIVSGDFYWFSHSNLTPALSQGEGVSRNVNFPSPWERGQGGEVLFAVVDCTGHGVPGAFISIVGHNCLNKCVNELKLHQPALILNELNKLSNETLRQKQHEGSIRDGMDIALVSLKFDVSPETSGLKLIDTNVKHQTSDIKLEYAGANNPLYIIRQKNRSTIQGSIKHESLNSDHVLYEIKADRQSVGNYEDEGIKSFTNHSLNLLAGDVIYIFSDGFIDQFGGPNGKKLKSKFFKEELLHIQNMDMKQQGDYLKKRFEEWCGNFEQIDDVCIFGVRLT